MEQSISKDQLRWCIKFSKCKQCPKHKECLFMNQRDTLIKQNFIHIDLGGYYGKRSNQTSTSKNKSK